MTLKRFAAALFQERKQRYLTLTHKKRASNGICSTSALIDKNL
jgi:hypothetical protein